MFENLAINVRNIYEKDWRPKEIVFFNPDCEKSDSIITINCDNYYRNVYIFIN